jgi:hypothetical protein
MMCREWRARAANLILISKRTAIFICCAIFVGVASNTRFCWASSPPPPAENSRLVALAARRFSNLTSAERAMLWFSDIDNVARGDFAVAGGSSVAGDPSNDPARADRWPASREIRASLIRWLCVDHDALNLADPKGIRVMGARIVGGIDLALVKVPIPLVFDNCVFTGMFDLDGAEIPYIELDGSYAREIHASGLNVRNNFSMGKGFHAAAIILDHSRIGLDLDCGGAQLEYAKNPAEPVLNRMKTTLYAYLIQVGGNLWLNRGFESHGGVSLGGAKIGANLHFDSGRFINPNNVAISVPGAGIDGVVFLDSFGSGGDVEVNGTANFAYDRIGDSFIVNHAQFIGAPGDQHGFIGTGMSVVRAFTWRNITLRNGALLDLGDASVGALLDDEQSWPAPGKLIIDGFTYNDLSSETEDHLDKSAQKAANDRNSVENRLRWLALQPPGFYSQPYNELAKYYIGSGQDAAAVTVYIAEEDDRYTRLGLLGRLWGGFLKSTIGYGHRPLLAFYWSVAVVMLGWLATLMGKRAGVMRLTWPENSPLPVNDHLNSLHPLLYSLDVFLPFVDLHQEHYWWPDNALEGECVIAGRRILVRGSALRVYLWLQIIAGWLLSAIFIAGVTGLIRND